MLQEGDGLSALDGVRPGWLPWWQAPGPEDIEAVSQQIGRPARGVVAIAARCRFGNPMVIAVAPLIDREPFPTTFWLTCPYLVECVSALESEGAIRRLAAQVRSDPDFARKLGQAHRAAAELRVQMAGETDLRRLEELSPRAASRVTQTGVAGIRHPSGIKCLHAHLADHLGRGFNPVGQQVAALLASRGVDLRGSASCRFERQLELRAARPLQ